MSSYSFKSHHYRVSTGMAEPISKHEDHEAFWESSEHEKDTEEESLDVPEEECKETMQLVQSLPSELSNQILESLWEVAFYPGFVYLPAHVADAVKDDYKKDPWAVRPTLLALSRAIHTDFQKRFWSENTFVLGAGQPPEDEDGVQRWFPEAATGHITKVLAAMPTSGLS
ncbi:MAG: hypothetical protein Q9173_006499 [Seirophora scorigena]